MADVLAYIAALVAHPAYTTDLRRRADHARHPRPVHH